MNLVDGCQRCRGRLHDNVALLGVDVLSDDQIQWILAALLDLHSQH